jgi:hypothetical protein
MGRRSQPNGSPYESHQQHAWVEKSPFVNGMGVIASRRPRQSLTRPSRALDGVDHLASGLDDGPWGPVDQALGAFVNYPEFSPRGHQLKSASGPAQAGVFRDSGSVLPASTNSGRSPRVSPALASAVLVGRDAISCRRAECVLEDRVKCQIVFHYDSIIPARWAGAGRSRSPARTIQSS